MIEKTEIIKCDLCATPIGEIKCGKEPTHWEIYIRIRIHTAQVSGPDIIETEENLHHVCQRCKGSLYDKIQGGLFHCRAMEDRDNETA